MKSQKYILRDFILKFSLFISSSLYSVCFVHCLDAPLIHIPDQGIIIGTYLKVHRAQNIKAYLGIPYAEAQRFSPPEIGLSKWNGVRNASAYAPDCWQKIPESMDKQTNIIFQLLQGIRIKRRSLTEFGENCLHLNVYIPDGAASSNGYAVVVWIHSGDFSYGSSTDIDPFQLVFKQKVIVVTVSYRLNIFGFLSTGDGEAQGNFGLMDQSAALFWIRRNINHFGGDENQITIMGHSAGAISVGLHLTSGEWSKNSFNKAIIMSGNPLSKDIVRMPLEYHHILDSISNIFGCIRKPTSMLIQCLKRVDAKVILDNIPAIKWGPVIDYGLSNASFPFIPEHPRILFEKRLFQKVPILIGMTDMEDVLNLIITENDTKISIESLQNAFIKLVKNDINSIDQDIWCNNFDIVLESFQYIYQNYGDYHNETMLYYDFVDFHTDRMYTAPLYLLADILGQNLKIYVYVFGIKPKTSFFNLPHWIRVPKYFDQIYIWGIPFMNNQPLVRQWNSTDKKMSDIIMTLWANFAKSSDPTVSNVYIKWNPYNKINRSLLVINEHFIFKNLNNNHRVHFWNKFYPRLLQFTIECCNMTSTSKSNYKFNIYLLTNLVLLHATAILLPNII